MCIAGLLTLLASAPAHAIPAFARRYQTSCTTCHVLVPKLNALGIAFRNNGYRIPPNDEALVRVPDLPLGAPGWKRLWPDAIWPGGIPGVAPVAFRVFSDAVVNPSAEVKLDFLFPNELEILAGGTAGDGISYFVELEVERRNAVNLSRAFVQFDRIGGTTLANLVVGRFEIRAVPFSRFHRRLTPSDFLAMDFRSPDDGLHLRRPQAGLEFWGARSGRAGRGGLEYAVGVVNGNGPFSDNNTAKDVYGRVSYKAGGFGVAGSSEPQEHAGAINPWRDDSAKVGFSVYSGRGRFAAGDDRFWRMGADADVFIGSLNVSAVVLRGHDAFDGRPNATRFTAASVESDYMVKPWLMAILRYEGVWRDDAADIVRVTPALVAAIRANVRLVAEWEAYADTSFRDARGPSGDTRGRLRLDLVF